MIKRIRKLPIAEIGVDMHNGINIHEFIDETKRYSIREALKATVRRRAKAAKLLSLSNHHILASWMDKLSIPGA